MSAVATTQEQQAEALKTLHRTAADQTEHLKELRHAIDAMLIEIAIGGGEMDRIVENSPVAGHKRLTVSNRRVTGTDTFPVALAVTDLLPSNPGRLGGQIINRGANAVVIYLARANAVITGATAAIWLQAAGGFWDVRLGNSVYSGALSVACLTDVTSTLTVAVA